MTLIESVKVCFKKYFDFEGRASRSEYWWFYLGAYIISSVTLGIGGFILIIPLYSSCVRRLHDVNRSGWWVLCPIYWIVLAMAEGDKGPNDYGPAPEDTSWD